MPAAAGKELKVGVLKPAARLVLLERAHGEKRCGERATRTTDYDALDEARQRFRPPWQQGERNMATKH